MTEFEMALQDCLHSLEQGEADVEECLNRYPTYARQLEPVLLTSAYLQLGREARPSAAFKARVRTKLVRQMHARPRQLVRSYFVFGRLALGMVAVLLAFLVTGTAYAQSVMPGNAFFGWKLASENVWRSVSPDPVGTDLALAERRLNELINVAHDPALSSQALQAYLEVVERLKSEVNGENEARILPRLDSQAEQLNRSGILLPPVDQTILPTLEEPTSIPVPTRSVTPVPVLETPQINATQLPDILPTVQVPSQIIPTQVIPIIPDPPKLIPTLEIPPPIP